MVPKQRILCLIGHLFSRWQFIMLHMLSLTCRVSSYSNVYRFMAIYPDVNVRKSKDKHSQLVYSDLL